MSHDVEELTTHCIRCGFCLESCPTYVETGSELESPRGRIYLVRSALEGKLKWQEDVKLHLDRCLGCRACETACPSGVQYGLILESARNRIEQEKPQKAKAALLTSTTQPALLQAQLQIGKFLPGKRIPGLLSKILSGQESQVDRPTPQELADFPSLDERSLPPVKGEVYLLRGCAMRVLYPRVHQATERLLRRIGYEVREVMQDCCGAMHAHNGYVDHAKECARNLIRSFDEGIPIIVNSAGCGSTMKEYGELLSGDNRAASFAYRTFDASEFLLANGLLDELSYSGGLSIKATYHDACHLAHGQRITQEPRDLIQAIPGLELVPLAEADRCCGSAGIYNVMQPEMARTLLDRKIANILATGACVVATGNPGCHAWIAQAAKEHGNTVSVLHTLELLEASFIGLEHFEN